MTDSTISSESAIDSTGFALLTGTQAEQALRSAIQRLERADDSSPELAQVLVKLGALRQEKGEHAEAEDLFRRALDIGERTLGSEHIELVQALTSLATARILRASPETAEPLFNRALSISTRYLGEDHPDLVIMVNDIARLYLKHGAYSFAEPQLQRLLSMKRSKGDDHPEVATVLASLAAVNQARGRHETSEELWRRVLAIRERTLAPNHFSQAVALEHLADVCTARGKLGEALQLFQRAQMIRGMTLGSDHASLRISRERIADLQLQASEESTEVHYPRTASPQSDDVRSADSLGINSPVGRRPSRDTKRRTRAESAIPFVERELPVSMPTQVRDPAPTTPADSTNDAEEREAAALAYQAWLEERQNATEEDEEKAEGRVRGIFTSVAPFLRKYRGETLAVAGVLAALVIAVATTTRAAGGEDQTIAEPPVGTKGVPVIPPSLHSATSAQPHVSVPDSAIATQNIAPPRPRALERRSSERVSARKPEPETISIPTVPLTMTNRFDSLVRAAGAPVRNLAQLFSPPPASSIPIAHSRVDFFESTPSQASHARLIGPLPAVRYPTQLRNMEGEVLVGFTVDTAGRPQMDSFTAANSPHALLTEAIRKVIQGLRFEPARSAAPESKPIVDRVQIRFLISPPTN
jgi:tetratricopeptide (TPR) repeat protein